MLLVAELLAVVMRPDVFKNIALLSTDYHAQPICDWREWVGRTLVQVTATKIEPVSRGEFLAVGAASFAM